MCIFIQTPGCIFPTDNIYVLSLTNYSQISSLNMHCQIINNLWRNNYILYNYIQLMESVIC